MKEKIAKLKDAVEAAKETEAAVAKLQALKSEIKSLEGQIIAADSEADAIALAPRLEKAKAAATVAELRKGKNSQLSIDEAWQAARITHSAALLAVEALTFGLHDEATFTVQDILYSGLDPEARRLARYAGDGGDISGGVAYLMLWGRVSSKLRMDFRIEASEALSTALSRSLADMEAFQAAEPDIREEVAKLTKAAAAVESILG